MAAESRKSPSDDVLIQPHHVAYDDRPDDDDDDDGTALSVTICVVLFSVILFFCGLAAAITHVIDTL